MAEERPIVIRFVGEDDVTTVANKVTKSVDRVGSTARKSSTGIDGMADSLSNVAGLAGATSGAVGGLTTALMSTGNMYAIAAGAVVGIGAAIFAVGDNAAKTANRVENLRKGIIRLADSEEEGQQLYETLRDIASRTPFERKDVIEMGRSLLSAGIEAEKIPDYIYAIGDAVTTIGGSAQNIDSVTTAIGRMQLSGRLSYEQMIQIQENGIPVFELLAKATGRSTEEVIKLSRDGLLPANGNLDTLIKAMDGKYGDAMATQMGTATQSASNFADAWEDMSSNFGNWIQPIITSTYDVATATINATNEAGQALNTWSTNYINATRDDIQTVEENWGGFRPLFESIGESASNTWNFITSEVQKGTDVLDDQGTKFLNIIKLVDEVGTEYSEQTPDVKIFWDTAKSGAINATTETANFLSETMFGFQVLLGTMQNNFGEIVDNIRDEADKMFAKPDKSFNPFENVYIGMGQIIRNAPAVVEGYSAVGAAAQQTTELIVDQNNAIKETNNSTNEYENTLRDYRGAIDQLRDSYMDIADAERAVESAEKALRDAQDPNRIKSMALALQMQQISLRDLNDSMAEMRARRNEIAEALKGMTDEQIRYNALTQKERDQYKSLGKDLDDLKKRREAVRKELAGNRLTNQQRVEFMQTEAALTALIGEKTDERQSLEQKQSDALKKSEEERLRLLEEDKRLRDELEKAQLRYQQSLVAISQAQQNLAEAQDPNRLNAYRDAVTKARNNLTELREEQINNAVTANDLAKKLGITSEVMDVLTKSASDTATPLDDAALKSLDLSKAVGESGGTTENVGELATNFDKLDADATSAVSGLTKVEGALKSLDALKLDTKLGVALKSIGDGVASIARSNEMFSVDNLTAPLTSIRNLAMELGTTESLAFSKWSDAYRNAVNGSTNSTAITNLIRALDALRDTVDGRSGTSGGGVGGRSGIRSMDGMRPIPVYENTASVQNITINLHYATPPSSNTPLKDVEDYLAAQGGRLRI
jgi:tape measure domain-containing protein